MSGATIEPDGEGRVMISGTLDFESVPVLLPQGEQYLQSRERLVVDLSGVSHTNSAGLAMLVAWMRHARREGAEIVFAHLPVQMQAAAQVTGVETLLPAADAE